MPLGGLDCAFRMAMKDAALDVDEKSPRTSILCRIEHDAGARARVERQQQEPAQMAQRALACVRAFLRLARAPAGP
jgi:hypothetical protein